MRLAHSRDFQIFGTWLDSMHSGFIQGAIMGVDENYSADVLRGRAQGMSILKGEMEKASDVAGRIQKIS